MFKIYIQNLIKIKRVTRLIQIFMSFLNRAKT